MRNRCAALANSHVSLNTPAAKRRVLRALKFLVLAPRPTRATSLPERRFRATSLPERPFRAPSFLAWPALRLSILVLPFLALPIGSLAAQDPARVDMGGDIQVGGEAERYLRALQLSGVAKPSSWTIRAAGSLPDKGSPISDAHPWQQQFASDSALHRFRFRLLRPAARLIYNSAFPAGSADGPTWAGRGVTGELRAGIQADFGVAHFQFAPVAFLAENAPFSLAPNGETGHRVFADARFPSTIDAPQRFGSRRYGRVDLGNTTLSLQSRAITFGVSTAAQTWGPGREYPLILSAHSGGFPHAFIGTGQPLNLRIFSLHARILTGNLSQSDYSPIDTGNTTRWTSAAIVSISPRGVTGLEFGLMRFVEGISTHAVPTLAQVRRALQGASLNNSDNVESENQIASAFFRWAFPGAGFEVYGEYARDDYSLDRRRFIQYPDDLRGYMFGFQRILRSAAKQLNVLRFELVNAELSAADRGERGDPVTKELYRPFPLYLHGITRQGHTNNGLFLGSAEAYGGAGFRLGFDRFDTRGRQSLTVERSLRLDWLPGQLTTGKEVQPDVVWAVGGEAVRFKGRREFGLSVSTMIDLNRNLIQNHDVFNLRTAFSVRGW